MPAEVFNNVSGMLGPDGTAVAGSKHIACIARHRVIPTLAILLTDADEAGHTMGHCTHAGAGTALLRLAPLLSTKVQLPQILEWVVHTEAQASSCPTGFIHT